MIPINEKFFDLIKDSHQVTSLMVFYEWDEQPSFAVQNYNALRDFLPDMSTPAPALNRYTRLLPPDGYTDYDNIRHYVEGDGALVTNGVVAKVVSGGVDADRSSKARRVFSAEVALHMWEDVPVTIVSSRVQIWTGVLLGSFEMMVPLGVFRVDSIGRTNRGTLSLSGASLEEYVIDDKWSEIGVIPKGTMCIAKIVEIINSSVPGYVEFDITPEALARDEPLAHEIQYSLGDSKWDVVESLAFDIECDVYCDATGKFRITPRPTFVDPVPVATVTEGVDGVLVTLNVKTTRDKTFNGWIAMGESSGSDVPPYSAVVVDDDPRSPTRWGGPFGKRLGTYKSKLLDSKQKCEDKARELLRESKAITRTLDLSSIPNPALEPDDVIRISMLDGTYEEHLLTKISIPLGLGEWSAETLSNKDWREVVNPDRPIEVPTPDTSQMGTFWRDPQQTIGVATSPDQVCWSFPAHSALKNARLSIGGEHVLRQGLVVVRGEVRSDVAVRLRLTLVIAAPGGFADFFQPGASVVEGLDLHVTPSGEVWKSFTVTAQLTRDGFVHPYLTLLVDAAAVGQVCVRHVTAEVRP